MPSYPTSVFAPASKNSGDTIQAAHVNDLDSEVNAVESGLLNGLQHALTISTGGLTVSTGSVNLAGPSSLTTLQVNGGSTFAGPVTFSSAVTFGANGTIALPRIPCARVTASAGIAIAADQWVGISWDTETYDSTGLHSTATNSSRINLTSSGLWNISACADFNGNATGNVRARLFVNDTTAIGGATQIAPGSIPLAHQVTARYLATSTADYVVLQVLSDSSTRSLANSTFHGGSWLAAERVSV